MLHIITPVKDSLATTLDTIRSVMSSRLSEPFTYTIYDDFSSDETAHRLDEEALAQGFQVVHLRDVTDHPSPTYLLVLRTAREDALAAVVAHYQNYIRALATRPLKDEYGNTYLYVDEDMRLRLETKLIHSIVTGFKVLPA